MRLRSLPAVAAVLAASVLLAAGPPAGAHDGDAIIVMEAAHPAGTSVHFIVRVTWEDDGHPAEDATVTATAESLAGDQLTPVPLAPEDDDGRYSGPVEFPSAGAWTVRFTSIRPNGTLEQIQEVSVAPSTVPTTVAPDGDSEVTVGTEADPGFAPEDDGTGGSAGAGDETAAASGDDGDGLPVWLIVLAAVVVVGGAIAAVGTIRRYRGDAAPGEGAPDEPAPGPDVDPEAEAGPDAGAAADPEAGPGGAAVAEPETTGPAGSGPP